MEALVRTRIPRMARILAARILAVTTVETPEVTLVTPVVIMGATAASILTNGAASAMTSLLDHCRVATLVDEIN